MPNPSPKQTQEFKSKQFQALGDIPGDIPLSKKNITIRLPVDVQDALDALPKEEKITFVRSVLSDATRKRLIRKKAS